MTLEGTSVLVTGADGFIGSHLVEQLVEGGARVRALVQYNSFNSWGWLEECPHIEAVEVVAGDVRDAHFVGSLVRGVEVVFHLAALIPIPYSYRAPESYLDTNVRGTLNLCQAAREHGVRRFVQTSTSEVYGTARYVPIDERHPLTAQSPYSASKIASDAMAVSFFHSFALPIVVARPFNTYGPRQSARAVIPTIVSQLADGHREVDLGELTATRDFTFVTDTCKGLIAVASIEGALGEVFNIGSNSEISIADLFARIAAQMNVDARIAQKDERKRPVDSEVYRLFCDNRKLLMASGFRPSTSLDEGLAKTIEWFREPRHLARYKSRLYNV